MTPGPTSATGMPAAANGCSPASIMLFLSSSSRNAIPETLAVRACWPSKFTIADSSSPTVLSVLIDSNT